MLITAVHKTAARTAVSPLRRFLSNSRVIWGDYVYGKIYNIENFRDNALILSALIQVLSRIFVANHTAKRTQNTPEGPFRYMEAVQTTFREGLGWFLSYMVLRSGQRAAVDFFRNFLQVRRGLTQSPTFLNGYFKNWLGVQADLIPKATGPFPTLNQTMFRFKRQWRRLIQGTPPRPLEPQSIFKLFPDNVRDYGVLIRKEGQKNYDKIAPVVNWMHDKLAGLDPMASQGQKLKTFFTWAPPLIGSVPALFLSGFLLERFNQTRAESIARRIANFLQAHSATGSLPPEKPFNTNVLPPSERMRHGNPAVYRG